MTLLETPIYLPHYNRSQAYPLGNYMYIHTPGKHVQFGITVNASGNTTLNNIILKSHAVVYGDVGIIVLSIIIRCYHLSIVCM